ncbi:uncharacterized protein LOC143602858 isoform X2 [Bidens hawaiensis]|uniref:uncharacterized protein LOC143602858 isoform X2 n=1 Tax=Bidens hawaiensis TaxID=980011 RepID=UPI004048F35C
MIPKADLEFAVGITNQLTSVDTGAGANATSKTNMMQFVRPDTLAELVWSPKTGLTIKFAEEKPCFMWEVGPTDMRPENTQNEHHITSLATCHATCKDSPNQGATNQLYEHLLQNEIMGSGDGSGSECRQPLKIEPMMQCRPHNYVNRVNVETDILKIVNQVESHRSVESCRSANLLTERKRKCEFDQQLILGSKRIKNQVDGSSFMNWISNTVKGFKHKRNVYDPWVGVCDGTSGFHNVFQSLFSPETIKQLENKSIGSSSLKETVLTKKCSRESLGYVKHISLYERVTKEAPKDMFDIIQKLRLSRTDIIKWMNSRSSVGHNLDGFYLRVRVAKWEEGAGGSKYYVACITRSQDKTDSKQSIQVKVGDVECLVQCQHVSNCDFVEDELRVWWEKTLTNGGIPVMKDLELKLAEKKTLGI